MSCSINKKICIPKLCNKLYGFSNKHNNLINLYEITEDEHKNVMFNIDDFILINNPVFMEFICLQKNKFFISISNICDLDYFINTMWNICLW